MQLAYNRKTKDDHYASIHYPVCMLRFIYFYYLYIVDINDRRIFKLFHYYMSHLSGE